MATTQRRSVGDVGLPVFVEPGELLDAFEVLLNTCFEALRHVQQLEIGEGQHAEYSNAEMAERIGKAIAKVLRTEEADEPRDND